LRSAAENSLPPVTIFDSYWSTTLAFVRSLGSRGVRLHVYGKGAGRWSRFCTRRENCPAIENATEFVPWLRDKVRSGAITRIAPNSDLIAYYCSLLRAEFSPTVRQSIAPIEEIERCLIKTQFDAACTNMGSPGPKTCSPTTLAEALSAADALGYPLLMKPRSHLGVGDAERGRLLHDRAQLITAFRPYKPTPGQEQLLLQHPDLLFPLLQRFIATPTQRVFSISGFKDPDAGIVSSLVSFKSDLWPAVVGTSVVQVSCINERVRMAGLKIVDRLLSSGIFELEMVCNGDQLLPIDLNPRAFGFIELDIALGSDLPWLWMNSTMGRSAHLPTAVVNRDLEARHGLLYFMRKISGFIQAGNQHQNSRNRRHSVSMLGAWSDPLPKLIGYLRVLRFPVSLIRSQLDY
jgi:D-aspartate ligase